MDDYISRQAAIDALRQERNMLDSLMDEYLGQGMPIMRSNAKIERNRVDNDIFIIDQLPSAPVREVVLCENCVKYERDIIEADGWCKDIGTWTNPDDFCSYGEQEDG